MFVTTASVILSNKEINTLILELVTYIHNLLVRCSVVPKKKRKRKRYYRLEGLRLRSHCGTILSETVTWDKNDKKKTDCLVIKIECLKIPDNRK